MKQVKIYVDGASGNKTGKPGGWAAIILGEQIVEISGADPSTTNNRMELSAAIFGLKHLQEPCEVELYSDSAYVVNCFKFKWYVKWQMNGWLNNEGNPVDNKDLWRELIDLTKIHKVEFKKVKGHSDNELNNRCDKLAKEAILKQKESNANNSNGQGSSV